MHIYLGHCMLLHLTFVTGTFIYVYRCKVLDKKDYTLGACLQKLIFRWGLFEEWAYLRGRACFKVWHFPHRLTLKMT